MFILGDCTSATQKYSHVLPRDRRTRNVHPLFLDLVRPGVTVNGGDWFLETKSDETLFVPFLALLYQNKLKRRRHRR